MIVKRRQKSSFEASPDSQLTLSVDMVNVQIGQTALLSNVSFQVAPQEFVAIRGPSGSGKTTLASVVLGLIEKNGQHSDHPTLTSGTVHYNQQDIYALGGEQRAALRRDYIGYAPQKPLLDPSQTAWQNISLPQRLNGKTVDKEQMRQWADLWQLTDKLDKPAGLLSGGEQQRVNLLRAVAGQPQLLLLDEPTSQLHPELKEDTNQRLSHFARHLGKTVIVITHEDSSAKRTIDLVGGEIQNTRPHPAKENKRKSNVGNH